MDDSLYMIDVRDVVQRMKDKCYGTIGEAFEDLLSDAFIWDDDAKQLQIVEF